MPLDYLVIVLPRAFSDLDEILTHVAGVSQQNAVSLIDRLQGGMASLSALPHRYKVHEHRKDPALTVRSMPIESFLVYYRVDDEKRVVRILHVRHGQRKQPRRFR